MKIDINWKIFYDFEAFGKEMWRIEKDLENELKT